MQNYITSSLASNWSFAASLFDLSRAFKPRNKSIDFPKLLRLRYELNLSLKLSLMAYALAIYDDTLRMLPRPETRLLAPSNRASKFFPAKDSFLKTSVIDWRASIAAFWKWIITKAFSGQKWVSFLNVARNRNQHLCRFWKEPSTKLRSPFNDVIFSRLKVTISPSREESTDCFD